MRNQKFNLIFALEIFAIPLEIIMNNTNKKEHHMELLWKS